LWEMGAPPRFQIRGLDDRFFVAYWEFFEEEEKEEE
jgi:hypothetical protein